MITNISYIQESVSLSNPRKRRWQYAACVIILLLFLGMVNTVQATHIVGGDMTYKCLGNDQFEITLTVRRDCNLGDEEASFDSPAAIGVYKCGELMTDVGTNGMIMMPYNGDQSISDGTGNCQISSDGVCVHEAVYKRVLTLPYKPDPYVLAYQRCCRNASLNNIVDPLETGATYYIEITPDAYSMCNSSPAFNQWADVYVCANNSLIFDHSATDPDGDSLVYKLTMPISGATKDNPMPQPPSAPPYDHVTIMPGFSELNFMGGQEMTLDARSGLLRAEPNIVGQYLIGVTVEEYRYGVKLSSVKRDFEYNVRVCDGSFTAGFEVGEDACNSMTVAPRNTSTDGDVFKWNFNYPNEDQAFYSDEIAPTFAYQDRGLYTIQLEVTRASDGCTSSYLKDVYISNGSLEASFQPAFVSCSDQEVELQLTDTSVENESQFEIVEWAWTINDGNQVRQSQEQNPVFAFSPGTEIDVELVTTSSSGCTQRFSQSMTIESTAANMIGYTIESCNDYRGLNITLSDQTAYADGVSASSHDWSLAFSDGTRMSLEGSSVTLEVEQNTWFTAELNTNLTNECVGHARQDFSTDLDDYLSFDFGLNGCSDDNDTVNGLITSTIEDLPGGATPTQINWTVVNGGETKTYKGSQINPFLDLSQRVYISLEVNYSNGCFASDNMTFDAGELVVDGAEISSSIKECDTSNLVYEFADVSDLQNTMSSPLTRRSWTIIQDGLIRSFSEEVIEVEVSNTNDIEVALTLEFENGCTFADTQIIPVSSNSIEVAFVSNPIIVCTDTPSRIIDNPNPSYTYEWSSTNGLTFDDFAGNPIVSVSQPTEYTVSITNGGCTSVESIEVIPASAMSMEIEGSTSLCGSGDQLSLSVSTVDGSTIEWADDPSFSNIIQTGGTFDGIVNADVKTLYSRRVFSNGCTSDVAAAALSFGVADINFTANPLVVCDEVSSSLIANPNSNYTYTWSSEEGLDFEDGNDKSNPIINTSISRTYIVTVNDGECESIASIDVIASSDVEVRIDGNTALCNSGDQLFLFASTVDGSVVEWSDDPLFSNIIGQSSSFDYSENTELNTLYARGVYENGCTSEVSTVAISRGVAEVEFTANPLVLCEGVSSSLVANANTDYTYTWSSEDGLTFEDANDKSNPTVSISESRTYTVTVNDGECETTASVDVIVASDVEVMIDGNTSICSGGGEITAAGLAGGFYEWSLTPTFDEILISGPTLEINFIEEPVTYYVREIFENGCLTEEQEVNITTGILNVEFISNPIVTCAGRESRIIANPNPEYTYTWSPEEGLLFEDPADKSNPIAIHNRMTRTYAVTVTDGNGCETISSIDVLPAGSFEPLILGEDRLCDNTFDLTVNPSSPNSVIEWTKNGSFNPIIFTGPNITGELEFPREVYYAREVFPNGCVSNFGFYALESAVIEVDFVDNPTAACGEVGTFLVIGGKEDFVYTWDPTDGLDFSRGTFNPVATPTENTTYNVTVTDGLCTTETSVFVGVTDTLSLNISGSEQEVCDDNITLTTDRFGLVDVEWSLSESFDSIISRSGELNYFQNAVEQTYYVRPALNNANCTLETSSFTVTSRAIALSDMVSTFVCQGDTVEFTFVSRDETQDLEIQWSPDDHIISGDLSSPTITIVSQRGEDGFDLSYTASNQYGCSVENGIVRFDSSPLDLSNDIITSASCGSLEVCFESPVGDGDILWDFGDDSTDDDISTNGSPCYTYPATGSYTVSFMENGGSGCMFEAGTIELNVNDAGGLSIAQDTTFSLCGLDSLMIMADTDDPSSVRWENTDGETLANGASIVVSDASSNPIIAIYDNEECRDTAVVNLIDAIRSSLTVIMPELSCEGDTVAVSVMSDIEGLRYSWEPEDCIFGESDTSDVVVWVTEDKDLTLIVNDPSTGCLDEITMPIQVNLFDLVVEASDTLVDIGDEVTISVFSERDDLSYEWNNGVTETSFTDTLSETTTYTLVVIDEQGCQTMEEITVTAQNIMCDETDVFIPSAFSPNGDGVNDELFVRSNFIETMELTVFDRWGKQMFITTNQDDGWNGRFNNIDDELPPDVYAYCLKATCFNDVDYVISGNVSLLR